MNKEKASALADEFHEDGFNCAQSVLAASSEMTGLDVKTALAIAGGFGGGLRCGEVCGAVSGAVMALGCMCPYNECGELDSKAIIGEQTKAFTDAFKGRFGYLRCADLKKAGLPCDELIKAAAQMVAEMESL